MKSKFLLLTLLAVAATIAASSVSGQDRIVKRNGDKTEAKVVEITDTHVRYRNSSNPDGPIYNVSLGEVRLIEYANGERDVIERVEIETPMDAQTMQNLSGGLSIRKNSVYMIGGTRLSRNQILGYTAPYQEVVRQIKAGYRMKRSAIILGAIGGGLIVNGIMAIAMEGYMDPFSFAFIIAGSALGGTSVGLGLGSVKAQKRAMQLYNEAAGYAALPRRDMSLSLAATRGGLGLQLNF